MQSIRNTALVMAIAAVAAGCSLGTNPPSSSPSVKKGELGNGGFTFRCDDSVACDRWNNADNFPKAVALGSNFDLQFLLVDGSKGYTWLKDAERGTTIEPVGKYIDRGASGFAAVEPGIATLSARDSKGWLVDYITVQIRKPDSLTVYDAEYKGTDPTKVARIDLSDIGDTKSYRVVARASAEDLAGSVAVEWTSADESIVSVQGYSRGKVTLIATGKGSTTVKAKGASLEQALPVTVGGPAPVVDGGADAAQEGGQQ